MIDLLRALWPQILFIVLAATIVIVADIREGR